MIFQKTLIIIVTPERRRPGVRQAPELTTDDLEKKINLRINDELLELQKDDGNIVLGVSVSSKDDIPSQHAFIATIMYRKISTRKVITEKTEHEKN
jgi:preprotein translocase subunit SecB